MEILESSNSQTGKNLASAFFVNRKRIGQRIQNAMVYELHEDTLRILDEKSAVIGGLVYQTFHLCVEDESFVSMNNLAVVIDLVDECDKQQTEIFSTYVNGLQMYRMQSDPFTDWSSKSADEQEIPRALIRAALTLKKPYVQADTRVNGNPRYITSEELTELIMRRPHDVNRIVDIVNQRDLPVGTEEGMATLKGLLDQETETPLIGGLL